MAEIQRPIISGSTDIERAASRARYGARERQVRQAMEGGRDGTLSAEGQHGPTLKWMSQIAP